MVHGMNSGHAGSLSTVHAASPVRVTHLAKLCLMADLDIPLTAIRRQLGEAIDVIFQAERDGKVRHVSEIATFVQIDDVPMVCPDTDFTAVA